MSEQDIEHLYSNERLTDNLTDSVAQALLKWGEQQLQAGIAASHVEQALRQANQTAESQLEKVLSVAISALHSTQSATKTVTPNAQLSLAMPAIQPRHRKPISPFRRRQRLIFKCSRNHGS